MFALKEKNIKLLPKKKNEMWPHSFWSLDLSNEAFPHTLMAAQLPHSPQRRLNPDALNMRKPG